MLRLIIAKLVLFITFFATYSYGDFTVPACGAPASPGIFTGQLPPCSDAISLANAPATSNSNVSIPDITPQNNGTATTFTVTAADGSLITAVNCGIGQDTDCASGYCGYDSFNSPINVPSLFGILLDDIASFGAPGRFLDTFYTLRMDFQSTISEGSFVTINNCNGDWAKCKPILYDNSYINASNQYGACANFSQAFSPQVPNLAKPAIDANGNFINDKNGNQVYCPLVRGNIPTGDMFYSIDNNNYYYIGYGCQIPGVSYSSGAASLVDPPVILNGIESGDQFCIQATFGTFWGGENSLVAACKYDLPPNPGTSPESTFAKSSTSVLGRFMYILNTTFQNMFFSPTKVDGVPNPILNFQMNLRTAVKVLLTLYVIAFGIKTVIGGFPKKAELFMFVLRFGFVYYFAVGTFNDQTTGAAVSQSANGLIYYFSKLFQIMAEFADNIIFAASSADSNFCNFNPEWYDIEYQYLALWDSLDCHIASYLGLNNLVTGTLNTGGIISLLWSFLIGLDPLMTLFLSMFVCFIIAVCIQLLQVFVLSMFGLIFLATLGPIFIPMALFSYTKGNFQHWLEQVFSYVFQPAVVSVGLAIMLVVLDTQVYDGCKFRMVDADLPNVDCGYSSTSCYAIFNTGTSDMSKCEGSIGYWISTSQISNIGTTSNYGFFTINIISQISSQTSNSLIIVVLFLFLFYQFANVLTGLAGDLTGGMYLGSYGASVEAMRTILEKGLKAAAFVPRLSVYAVKKVDRRLHPENKTTATTTDKDKAAGGTGGAPPPAPPGAPGPAAGGPAAGGTPQVPPVTPGPAPAPAAGAAGGPAGRTAATPGVGGAGSGGSGPGPTGGAGSGGSASGDIERKGTTSTPGDDLALQARPPIQPLSTDAERVSGQTPPLSPTSSVSSEDSSSSSQSGRPPNKLAEMATAVGKVYQGELATERKGASGQSSEEVANTGKLRAGVGIVEGEMNKMGNVAGTDVVERQPIAGTATAPQGIDMRPAAVDDGNSTKADYIPNDRKADNVPSREEHNKWLKEQKDNDKDFEAESKSDSRRVPRGRK